MADLLFATAPAPGLALRKLATLLRSFDIHMTLEVRDEDACTTVTVHAIPHTGELSRREVEYALAICCLRKEVATGMDLAPLRLELVDAPETREHREVLERTFGCEVRYNQPLNRLWFRKADLERAHPYADAGLFSVLEVCAATVPSTPDAVDPILASVQRIITEEMGYGPLLVERAARKLGMSSRTLQRRLRAAGTTFSRILERAREEQARRLLDTSNRSLSEIAGELGFSEHSAFSRAFKRWTGRPPKRFRIQ